MQTDLYSYCVIALLCFANMSSATHLFDEKLVERNMDMLLEQAKAMTNRSRDGVHRLGSDVFSQQFEPIRIKVEFHESIHKSRQSSRLKRVVRDAVSFWEKKLKVRRVNNAEGLKLGESFKVTKSCDVFVSVQNVQIRTIVKNHQLINPNPKCLAGENAKGFQDTDLILFVSNELGKLRNKEGKPGWCKVGTYAVATAVDIRSDEFERRPVAGIIDICNVDINDKQLIRIMQHEIAHALGFSFDQFPWFRKKDHPHAFHDGKVKQFVRDMTDEYQENGVTEELKRLNAALSEYIKQPQPPVFSISDDKCYLATPKVKETAREFFACPSISGAPMHINVINGKVGDGSSFSHFDEQTVVNDLMSAATNEQQLTIPTPLTFSVFEDSGWYELMDDSDLDVDKFRNSPESANVAGLDAGCGVYGDQSRKENNSPNNSAFSIALTTVLLIFGAAM